MGLVEHAEYEMKRAGLYDKDANYGGLIPEAVLALVKAHADQGHSGGSHWVTLGVFEKVIRYQTLTPVTSDPSEWFEASPGMWQNRRCSSKFSPDAGKTWYDIDKPLKFQRARRILGLRTFAP